MTKLNKEPNSENVYFSQVVIWLEQLETSTMDAMFSDCSQKIVKKEIPKV